MASFLKLIKEGEKYRIFDWQLRKAIYATCEEILPQEDGNDVYIFHTPNGIEKFDVNYLSSKISSMFSSIERFSLSKVS